VTEVSDKPWDERSRMGLLRGVLDFADPTGRRNEYLNEFNQYVLRQYLRSDGRRFQRALDFGCGTGRLLPLLSEFSKEVRAIDRSNAMVDAAKAYNPQFAATIEQGDGTELGFPGQWFDLALCNSVLSVTEDGLFSRCITELARVCKSGGLVILYEKICDSRGLTPRFYTRELRRSGFRILKHYPARSGTSRFTWMATEPWFLPMATRALAAIEFQLTKRRRYRATSGSYVEYFIACERL
jgi:SAM-dependent methyltransferase